MKRRLFLGIPLTDDVRRHLKSQLHDIPGRAVPSPNWHFTLHFLGDVEEENEKLLIEELKKRESNMELGKSFEITVTHLGAFPTLRYAKIMWVGIKKGTEEMTDVAAKIGESLKQLHFKVDERPYVPHLTIARFQRPKNLTGWLEHHSLKSVNMKVEEIILYESILGEGGSQYNKRETFFLKQY